MSFHAHQCNGYSLAIASMVVIFCEFIYFRFSLRKIKSTQLAVRQFLFFLYFTIAFYRLRCAITCSDDISRFTSFVYTWIWRIVVLLRLSSSVFFWFDSIAFVWPTYFVFFKKLIYIINEFREYYMCTVRDVCGKMFFRDLRTSFTKHYVFSLEFDCFAPSILFRILFLSRSNVPENTEKRLIHTNSHNVIRVEIKL